MGEDGGAEVFVGEFLLCMIYRGFGEKCGLMCDVGYDDGEGKRVGRAPRLEDFERNVRVWF